jgi:hypothetical protein
MFQGTDELEFTDAEQALISEAEFEERPPPRPTRQNRGSVQVQQHIAHTQGGAPVTPHTGGLALPIGLAAVVILFLLVVSFTEIERAQRLQQTAHKVRQTQAPQQRRVVPKRYVAPRRPRRETAKKPVITSSWKRIWVKNGGDLWNSPYAGGRVIGRIESRSFIQYEYYKLGWYKVITEDGKHGFAGVLFP